MSNDISKPEEQKGNPLSIVKGIMDFLGILPGERVRKVHIQDNPIQAFVKSMLGSIAFARSEGSEVTIELEAEDHKLIAEGQKEADVTTAEVKKEMAKARRNVDHAIQEV